MKTISVKNVGEYNAKEILSNLVKQSPKGADLNEVRRRVRVLTALDKCSDEKLSLEDADFDTLKHVLETSLYGMATVESLTIIEAAMTPLTEA